MRRLWLYFTIGLLLAATPANAKRYGLVIGVDNYKNINHLFNAIGDAKAFAALLQKHGISVDEFYDANAADLRDALDVLESKIERDDEVIVYYSGHGMSLGKGDIIAPVDVDIDCDLKSARRSIQINDILGKISLARIKIVLIDACRNNPLPAACPASKGGASGAGFRGLKLVDTRMSGFLLASSTLLDTTASDGAIGSHSPFAEALLKQLSATPAKPWPLLINEIAGEVARETEGHQVPEIVTRGSTADACLAGTACGITEAKVEPPPPVVDPPAPAKSAAVDWLEVKASNTPAVLKAFIADHPEDKTYLALAEERLALLTVKPELPKPAECGALLVSVADRKDCLKPGDVFHDFEDGPEMVVVPPGTFEMGASPEEIAAASKEAVIDLFEDEGPQHEVTISKAFAVGKFEVTKGQYAAFVEATGYAVSDTCYTYDGKTWTDTKGKSWRDPGYPQADDHPVVCVSWDDAKAYVTWLAGKSGKNYRLLSEAEWEYAARAGSTGRYSWGETASHEFANYGKDKCCTPLSDGKDQWNYTSPVGKFPSNNYRLFDVSGNVWEWTEDCYIDTYKATPSDGSAQRGNGCVRVFRGGGWGGTPPRLRSALRFGYSPGIRDDDLGFRLARTISP